MAKIMTIPRAKIDLGRKNLIIFTTNPRRTAALTQAIKIAESCNPGFSQSILLLQCGYLNDKIQQEKFDAQIEEYLHVAHVENDACSILHLAENVADHGKESRPHISHSVKYLTEALIFHRLLRSKLTIYMVENYHSRGTFQKEIVEMTPSVGFYSNIDLAVARALFSLEKDTGKHEEEHEAHYSPKYRSLHSISHKEHNRDFAQ